MSQDAGQKQFGAVACSVCGMLYSAANPEDESQHLLFHNQFISAVKYVVRGSHLLFVLLNLTVFAHKGNKHIYAQGFCKFKKASEFFPLSAELSFYLDYIIFAKVVQHTE